MSPEQFTLQDLDARSDIYSLGVVAYQMLAGRLPFDAKDPMEWAAFHMGAEPAPLEVPGLYIPDSMHHAIMRALAKYPADRPQSMRELFSLFTIGTGTLPPGRASSVLPRSPSEWPRPSKLLSDLPKAPRAPSAALLGKRAGGKSEATTTHDAAREPEHIVRNPAARPPPPDATSSSLSLSPVPPQRSLSDELTHESTAFETSSPDLSFHESELSMPLPGISPANELDADEPATRMKAGKKGTLVMSASEPPPPAAPPAAPSRSRMTMPDLLPPTVREPLAGVSAQRGKGRWFLFGALGLVVLGAVVTLLVWTLFVDDGAPRAKRDGVGGPPRPGTLTAPTAKIDVPADPTVAAPPASVTPSAVVTSERLSPCQTAVFTAVSGQCDGARKAYARCSEDSPYHPSAERAMKGLCP